MELLRTDKEAFTEKEILEALDDFEKTRLPHLQALWDYYKADNPKIRDRQAPDPNAPDNKTKVSYGRKLVKTFQGYGYRPGYITYKSDNASYLEAIQHAFDVNDEKVKTSRTGRDTAVYGHAYELFYVAKETDVDKGAGAEVRFINVDPRQMLVFYDYSAEPQIKIAIRYYPVTEDHHKVEVRYPGRYITYDRVKAGGEIAWKLENMEEEALPWETDVPVVAYYMGDEKIGIIEPVETLIADYDLVTSDAMNEFDRFSNAYLLLKGMSLTKGDKKDTTGFSGPLARAKRRRAFENLSSTDDVKFLLKDTPTAFIAWLAELIREEIHKQSHVPDFMSEKMGGDVSGVAVARLMFDFENLVSAAEGDFDIALRERIRLITAIHAIAKDTTGEPADITISHKRNVPLNVKEFAETAAVMRTAGFSKYLIADQMPDDIIPNVEEELERQQTELTSTFGDLGDVPEVEGMEERPTDTPEDVQAQALNGAQIKSMVDLIVGVTDETLAPESAKALLLIAIPSLTREQANAMIDPATSIEKPTPPPVPPQFGAPPPPVAEEDGEA